MSRTLQASAAPVLNRIVITNLQQNVDEDRIVLHLEQRKVTLVDDVEVTIKEFDEANHAAIVSLTDASGRHVSLINFVPFLVVIILNLCLTINTNNTITQDSVYVYSRHDTFILRDHSVHQMSATIRHCFGVFVILGAVCKSVDL